MNFTMTMADLLGVNNGTTTTMNNTTTDFTNYCPPNSAFPIEIIIMRLLIAAPIGVFGVFANILNLFFLQLPAACAAKNSKCLIGLSLSDLMLLIAQFGFLELPALTEYTQSHMLKLVYPYILK